MSTSKRKYVTSEGKTLEEADIKERIEKLRAIMNEDDNVRNLRQDDAYLKRFLFCCDFDVDAAYRRMQEYYNLLREFPDWFAKGDPLRFKKYFEDEMRMLIPDTDKEGRPIYICKIGNIDPRKITLQELVQFDQTYLELIMDDSETMEKGISVIMDVEGYSWKLFKWLTPSNMRISSKLLDAYPLKTFRLHVVNTSALVNISIKLFWPFLSDKIKNMIIFHFDNLNSLHAHINPEVLPPEYGGYKECDYQECYQPFLERSTEISEKLKYHSLKCA